MSIDINVHGDGSITAHANSAEDSHWIRLILSNANIPGSYPFGTFEMTIFMPDRHTADLYAQGINSARVLALQQVHIDAENAGLLDRAEALATEAA
jgi:hypothetical protein